MSVQTGAAARAELPHASGDEPVRDAVLRLARALPDREDSRVLLDFLEDDLREGLGAIAEVEAHFTDLLDTLRARRLRPISLLEAGDDDRVLDRLEYLMGVVSQLRRRLAQAAGKMRLR